MTYRKMGERASPSCGTILSHYTLHNYLVVVFIEWFFKLSALAAAAMRACGCSFLPSATDYADKDARQQRIDRQNYWSDRLLPVRVVLLVVLFVIHYPLFLFFALLQALYTRLVRGGEGRGRRG